jgi:hypothetical protein
MRLVATGLFALLASACTATVPSGSGTPSAPASGIVNVGLQRLTDAEPIRSEEAMIGIAFDAAGSAALVSEAPAIDYAGQALLCLALGERATGGWSVTIQSISLDGPRMSIRAREVRPRSDAGATQGATYPADCAVIDRTVLPVGELVVRADDTISDEFIVEATIEVPSR